MDVPARRVETITVREISEDNRLGFIAVHALLTGLLRTFALFKRRDTCRVLDRNPLRDHIPQDVRNPLAGQLVVIPQVLHLLGVNPNRAPRLAHPLFLHMRHR
jgi:hypothetical protein